MMKKVILAVIIIIGATSLLLYLPNPMVAENNTGDNPASFEYESVLNQKDSMENVSESAILNTGETARLNDYPDALNLGGGAHYDEETYYQYPAGDNKNDISVTVDETRISTTLYLKNLFTGSELPIEPRQDFKYLLVKVSAAPLGEYLIRHTSPVTNSFELLDFSEVYSPLLNISENMGAVLKNDTSWDNKVNKILL